MASKEIKGLVIQIEGNSSSLVKSLKEVDNQIKKDEDALKSLNKALALDPKNVDLLAAKQKVLADKTEQTAQKMNILKQVQKDALGDLPEDAALSASQMAELQSEISGTENELKQMSGAHKAFESLKEGAANAKEKLEDVGEVGKKIGGKIVDGVAAATKALAAMGAAAGAATVAAVGAISKTMFNLGKQVVQQYADYEQALGGSEAVFEQYAGSVQKAAKESWRTMGTTEEQFLASANKVGALFQGTGVSAERSAELTTQAMTRAADMASVMGIDTQAALDAITGAAKGNYTMMDNLGIKMDKTTLEAYAMAKGFKTAWKDMSGAEQAEVAMQYFFENTSKYAGNFEREATETISGSIGMLQSAWSNLITGLGDSDADIAQLTQNVVTSFDAVATNVMPIIENLAQNLPTMISGLLSSIEPLLGPILDSLLGVITSLLQGIAGMLPQIASTITELITSIADTIAQNEGALGEAIQQIIDSLVRAIVGLLPTLIPIAVDALNTIVNAILDNIDIIIDGATAIVLGLVDGIINSGALTKLVAAAITLIEKLCDALLEPKTLHGILQAAADIIITLAQGIAKAAPKILPKVIDGLIEFFLVLTEPQNLNLIIDAAIECALAIVQGLVEAGPRIGQAVVQIVANIVKILIEKGPEILSTVLTVVGGIITSLFTTILGMLGMNWEEIQGNFDEVMTFIGEWLMGVVDSVVSFFTDIGEKIGTFVTDTISSIGQFFTDIWTTLTTKVEEIIGKVASFFATIWTTVTTELDNILGKVTGIFSDIWEGLKQSAIDIGTKVQEIVDGIKEKFEEVVGKALSWGKDMIDNIGKGIKEAAENLWEGCKWVGGKIKSFLGFSVPEDGPLAEWATHNPGYDMMMLFKEGMEDGEKSLMSSVGDVAQAIANFLSFSVPEEGPLSTFDRAGGDMIQVFIDGMMGEYSSLMNALMTIAQAIANALSAAGTGAFNAGKSMMQQFLAGMNSMYGNLLNTAKTMAQTIANYLHFSTPKEGPLKDFDKSGGDMMTVFIQGMKSQLNAVAGIANKTFQTATTGALQSAKEIGKDLEKIYNSVGTGGLATAKALNDAYNKVGSNSVPNAAKNATWQHDVGNATPYGGGRSGGGGSSGGGGGSTGSLPKEINLIVNLGQQRFAEMVAKAIDENTYVAGGY